MIQKMIVFISVFSLLILHTGCWDLRELDDLAFIVAMGIDKVGDQFVITTQVVNPAQIASDRGGGNKSPVVTYQTRGKTLLEALNKRSRLGSRETFTSQMKMLIISEKLAKSGFSDVFDFIYRSNQIESDFYIVVAKNTTASSVLNVLTPLENTPATELFSSMESLRRNVATVLPIRIDDLVEDLTSDGLEAKLTGIEVIGETEQGNKEDNVKQIHPEARLRYSSIAVFHKDKLVGWLNDQESKGLNYILDKINRSMIRIPCPHQADQEIALEVAKSKTDLKGVVRNQKPEIMIEVHTTQNVNEVQCQNLQLTNPETIQKLTRLSEKPLKQTIKSAIYAAQKKYKTDILGFGEAIHRENPAYWKQMKGNWDQEFVKIPVHIKTDITILRTGTVSNSFLNKIRE